jgi:transposase
MSTTDTKLPELPNDTATQLVALKGSCPEEFYALVKALRLEGWPLRAIATPFSVSRTAAQGWENKYKPETPLPEVPELPVQAPKDRKNSSKKYSLNDDEIQNLKSLATLASTVRRYTDQNAPSRRAAHELEAKLLEYSNRGLSRTQLAGYCGVSDSSIKQRLRKYI